METVFIIRNQHGQCLSRDREWIGESDGGSLYRARFRDEAINTLVELNAHDIDLRGSVEEVPVDSQGRPETAAVAAGEPEPPSSRNDDSGNMQSDGEPGT